VAVDHDVVVVGAGLAGLALARYLAGEGIDVLVLEARDRVGGRTLSRTIRGARFELGAQWVGPTQHRLLSLARELEIETFPQFHDGKKVLELDGERSTYAGSIPSISVLNLVQTELMVRRVDRMAEYVPLDRPYLAELAEDWDSTTVESFKRSLFGNSAGKKLFDVAARTVFGAEPAELSLLYFLFYLNSAGGFRKLIEIEGAAQQERFVVGAQTLCERLVGKLGDERVVTDAAVSAIEQRDGAVVVRSAAGEFSAQRVVVAIPPHLTSRIRFEPTLGSAREQLVQRWGMGATVKILAFYETAKWRELGYSGEAVSTDGPISVVFDNCSHDGNVPCLLGFVVGKHARRWSEIDPVERRRQALSTFERLLGAPAAAVVDYHEQDWSTEPWTGGCPVASLGTGALSTFKDAWREPVGRVHWAGTETARHWNGYLEGALESAERVASEVLGALR
jgi:monoamine oxidase